MGRRTCALIILWLSILLALTLIMVAGKVFARDNGQWTQADAITSKWVRSLMQPDNPVQSCCGDADAYWADDFTVVNGEVVVIITDDRPDEPLGRPHREIGERFIIPDSKMKWDAGNPTPHGWLFLSYNGRVYCYVTPGGV